MKKLNKNIIAIMLMTAVFTGCGNSTEVPDDSSADVVSESEVESETEIAEEVTTHDYSEAKAKIEALQKRIENYVNPIYSEKECDYATIIMTEYPKSGVADSYWTFYAVDDEDKICYENIINTNVPGHCSASPDGDTRFYSFFTGPHGTYTFYVTYYSEYYDIYYYNESEPVVIDASTVIEDSTFYSSRTTSSYYFNCSNLVGDAKYEMRMARLDKQLSKGEITEEEYYESKTKIMDMYKN